MFVQLVVGEMAQLNIINGGVIKVTIMIQLFEYFKEKMGYTDLDNRIEVNTKVTEILLSDWRNEIKLIRKHISELTNYQDEMNDKIDYLSGSLNEVKERVKIKMADSDFEKLMDSKYTTTHLYYKKRYIFNKETKVTLPVTDFIKDWNCLPRFNSLKDVFEKKITYTSDKITSGVSDFWEYPWEIVANGYKSDCESSSFLRIALASKIRIPIYACLGMYKGTGHCYCVYLENGQLYYLESTSNKFEPIKINNNDISKTISGYTTYYVFSGKKVWKINQKKEIKFGSKIDGLVF